ncbi:MAG: TonB-dependent receptor [Gammaproteobacteria bacterium]|nr:TonB-dependent receptor [Gammaproteobacteria bacterium]
MNRKLLLSLAIGLSALPTASLAQSSPQSDSAVLEEIVVTAERREASLQTVPVPVTAITAETLEKRQITEAKDLARYAPSLKMLNNITSPTNLSPSLRGSLQQDASQIVAESPFGIYVDDVYIARLNGNNVTLADIERVEVLRGPQGTLYGRNTLTGAIKFISRTPGQDSWMNASVSAGNFEQQRVSVSTGGPLSENGWAGSFSAQYNNLDGQFFNKHPTVAAKTGLERNWAARGKLHYDGIENLDIVASVSFSDAKNDSGQLIAATTPKVASNKQFTSNDLVPTYGTYIVNTPNKVHGGQYITNVPSGATQQTIASLNIGYKLGGATLRSITGYVKTKDAFSTDFSGAGNISGSSRPDVDQYSEELQIVGKALDDKLDYLAGLYFFNEEGTQPSGWDSYYPGFFPETPISNTFVTAETDSFSVFAQGGYQLSDALKATAGVRYTKDKKKFDLLYKGLFPGLTPALATVKLANDYTQTTPRFGIDYTLPTSGSIDSMMIYASTAKGFKSGGYSAIAIFGIADNRAPYKPETNWTTEVGVKTDMLGNRLRINANYYYEKADELALNAQVITNGLAGFPVENAGKATIQGLEFEITAVPADGLTLTLSGTALTDAKFTELNPTSAPANALKNYGVNAVPPQLPDFSYNAGFDYGYDVSIGRISFGADWFYTDDYITSATNEFKVSGYGQGNAFVGLSFSKNWSARFAVKNFTDENDLVTGSRGFLGGFIPLRPRSYLLTVDYKLD